MSICNVSTLGPPGTCSEMIAGRNMERIAAGGSVVLFATYEAAAEAVIAGSADALLVAAAYPRLNEIVFRTPRSLKIVDSFVDSTPPLVAASRLGYEREPNTVTCAPATVPLARTQFPDAEIVTTDSNSEAAIQTRLGCYDAGITTLIAATHEGLEVLHDFGSVPMAWVVFRRAT